MYYAIMWLLWLSPILAKLAISGVALGIFRRCIKKKAKFLVLATLAGYLSAACGRMVFFRGMFFLEMQFDTLLLREGNAAYWISNAVELIFSIIGVAGVTWHFLASSGKQNLAHQMEAQELVTADDSHINKE